MQTANISILLIVLLITISNNISIAQLYVPGPGPVPISGKNIGLQQPNPFARMHIYSPVGPVASGGSWSFLPAIRLEYEKTYPFGTGSYYWDIKGENNQFDIFLGTTKVSRFSPSKSTIHSTFFTIDEKVAVGINNTNAHTYGIGLGANPSGNQNATHWLFPGIHGGAILTADKKGNFKIINHSGGGALNFNSLDSKVSMLIDREGRVGVGTLNPTVKLEVLGETMIKGKMGFQNTDDEAHLYLGDGFHYIKSVHGKGMYFGTYGAQDAIYLSQPYGDVGIGTTNLSFGSKLLVKSHNKTSLALDHTSDHDYGYNIGLSVNRNLTKAIGLNNSGNEVFILWGNGTINAKNVYAQKVHVKLDAMGTVFEEDYSLTSLEEVEAFIQKHKHLPEISPAAEVEENGMDLGEMNVQLLKKVEELTLYLIEQNKQIEALSEEIKELRNQIENSTKNQ